MIVNTNDTTTFIKWFVGIFSVFFTASTIGMAGWIFQNVNTTRDISLENASRLHQVELSINRLESDVEEIKDLQLKLLAADQLAIIEQRKRDRANGYKQ